MNVPARDDLPGVAPSTGRIEGCDEVEMVGGSGGEVQAHCDVAGDVDSSQQSQSLRSDSIPSDAASAPCVVIEKRKFIGEG